jgi:hypothetical protein
MAIETILNGLMKIVNKFNAISFREDCQVAMESCTDTLTWQYRLGDQIVAFLH